MLCLYDCMYFFCMKALNQKATYIGTKLLTGPVSEQLCTEQSQFCNFSYFVENHVRISSPYDLCFVLNELVF
jgi:hypothetical protein